VSAPEKAAGRAQQGTENPLGNRRVSRSTRAAQRGLGRHAVLDPVGPGGHHLEDGETLEPRQGLEQIARGEARNQEVDVVQIAASSTATTSTSSGARSRTASRACLATAARIGIAHEDTVPCA